MSDIHRPPITIPAEITEADAAVALYYRLKCMHEADNSDDSITTVSHDDEHKEHIHFISLNELIVIHTILTSNSLASHIVHVETVPSKHADAISPSIYNIYDTVYEEEDDTIASTGRHNTFLDHADIAVTENDQRYDKDEQKKFAVIKAEVDDHPSADLAQLLGLLGTKAGIAK